MISLLSGDWSEGGQNGTHPQRSQQARAGGGARRGEGTLAILCRSLLLWRLPDPLCLRPGRLPLCSVSSVLGTQWVPNRLLQMDMQAMGSAPWCLPPAVGAGHHLLMLFSSVKEIHACSQGA